MSTPLPLTMIQLGCFVAVAETGSFAEAGRRLGMSTSGVSKTIARLELARAVRLFNRSTHAVSLTPEGERLLPLTREAVRGVEEVDAALSIAASSGAVGRVRLSAPTAFLNACVAPLLPRFREALPHVSLDLRGSDVMVDLAQEAFDLVLRTGLIKGIPGHRQQALFSFPWVTCASPDYLARRGKPLVPADLASHDLVGFRNQRTGVVDPWRYGQRRRSEIKTIRFPPTAAIVMDDANAIVAAAVSGTGIAWAPRWLVSAALRAGALIPLLSDWTGEEMKMFVVRRVGPAPKRTEQVISFLRKHRLSFV
jgi:DNA-binding transcriptional LysR family regulator